MSAFRKKPSPTVVVDFSERVVKLAAAETCGDAVRLRGVAEVDGRESADPTLESQPAGEERALLLARLRKAVRSHGWQGFPAACVLPIDATSTQSYSFPDMPDSELRQAIGLKLPGSLHFDVEDAVFGFRRIDASDDNTAEQGLVQVIAAEKHEVRRQLDLVRQAGLRPVSVGAASEALACLGQRTTLGFEQNASIHAHMGRDTTTLNLFDGRVLRFSREVDVGYRSFTEALLRPIFAADGAIDLTEEQALEIQQITGFPVETEDLELPWEVRSSEVLPLLEPIAQRLSSEIRRSVDYLEERLGGTGCDRVVLSGPRSLIRNLDRRLQEDLGVTVQFVDPVARARNRWRFEGGSLDPEEQPRYATVLGQALGSRQMLNLVPREERAQSAMRGVARVQKVLVPGTFALAGSLAGVAFPIERTYGVAHDQLRANLERVESDLRSKVAVEERLQLVAQEATNLVLTRGERADFSGVMRELSMLLPDSVKLTSLESTLEQDTRTLHLVAEVLPSGSDSRIVLAKVTTALSRSPLFADVKVLVASVPYEGSEGKYEATMRLVPPAASNPDRTS